MQEKITKQKMIEYLGQTDYLASMDEDELLDWYIDLAHGYDMTTGDDSLDVLFEKYWEPDDVVYHVISLLQDPHREQFDALQEVEELLSRKDFNTWWSHFETDEEVNFVDITKEELERLRQRILDALTKEEEDE